MPRLIILAFVLLLAAAADAADLVLQPTELVLIDGRKVSGRLACELDQHLIVYSPGLGTLASFRKEFVASYTRGGKAVNLSPARKPAAEELARLDWNGWPDAVPALGPKPAYATETWEAPTRLLVWAKPGSGGVFTEAANWLVLGAPLGEAGKYWDATTDVILPAADLPYAIAGGNDGSRIELALRHAAIENGASLSTQDCSVHGNEWVRAHGRFSMRFSHRWVGGKHTMARNEYPTLFKVGVTWNELPEKDRPAASLGQYLVVRKEAGSVEFLGVLSSNDKFYIEKGVAIAGPGSQCMSDNRNGDWVAKGATLHLMDGVIWGKRKSFIVSHSLLVEGTLTAGMPERPLSEDATIIMSFKDYTGLMGRNDQKDACGLRVAPGGILRVYSSNPAKARLVLRDSRCERGPESIEVNVNPSELGRRMERYRTAPHRIDVVLLGDVVLDGVLFEDVHRGGLRLKDLDMKDAWKHVAFGPGCGSQKPEELFAIYQKDTPPSGWLDDAVVRNPPPLKDK